MKTDKWLWNNIVVPIYNKMYAEATPSADFDELIAKLEYEGKEFDWDVIKTYYLSEQRQNEIFAEITGKYELTKRERHRCSKTIFLGFAPSIRRDIDE